MLFLQTQTYKGHGGVQTYMRRLAEVLSSICEDAREPLVSVSLNDSVVSGEVHLNRVRYEEFIGSRQNKLSFVHSAVRVLRRRKHGIAVLGHINLATTGYWLRKCGLLDGYVIVLHGIEAWTRKTRGVRVACRHAAAIVATTRYTACEFQMQNGFAHRHMYVVPISLPDHALPPCLPQPSPAESFTVLTVGRLDSSERYKGVDTLIVTVGAMAREGFPIRLQIVGDGNDRERLREYSLSAAPANAIEFLGNVPDEQLPDVYCGADLFAMPSRGEGFGLVFLEAMRHGKPCIGGRHGGTPEVIRNGVDGFLVEYGERHELDRRLRQLVLDRPMLERLGRNAYEHAASRFTFPTMRERWRTILSQLDGRWQPDVVAESTEEPEYS